MNVNNMTKEELEYTEYIARQNFTKEEIKNLWKGKLKYKKSDQEE